MNARYAISAYQSAQTTVSSLQAVVMLYDGVLVRLRNAEEGAARHDWETQFNEVTKAVGILRGLLAATEAENGGSVTVRLREAYEANMHALMHSVGRPNACECLRRIAGGLRDLRDAWAGLAGMPPLAGTHRAEN